jgi:hypothetical protein
VVGKNPGEVCLYFMQNLMGVARNIARYFINKPLMKKRVVNKTEGEPLLLV